MSTSDFLNIYKLLQCYWHKCLIGPTGPTGPTGAFILGKQSDQSNGFHSLLKTSLKSHTSISTKILYRLSPGFGSSRQTARRAKPLTCKIYIFYSLRL